jgi:ParB family chromosome partitioning protein
VPNNSNSNRKTGLGKGLQSLMPANLDTDILINKEDRVQKIRVSVIKANPNQPRRQFDDQTIEELAVSIKQVGILQPLIVTPRGEGYLIIAGERRWRAAQKAKLDTVPVIVKSAKELGLLEMALIENIQRVDLSPLEFAVTLDRLKTVHHMEEAELTKRLGKDKSTIRNILRLLNLPDYAKEALNKKQISEGHARAVLALKEYPDQQRVLVDNIIKYVWSVRQAEQFVTGHKTGKTSPDLIEKHMKKELPETKSLSKLIAAPVSIRRTAHGGKLEISFTTDKDLERLIKLLLER